MTLTKAHERLELGALASLCIDLRRLRRRAEEEADHDSGSGVEIERAWEQFGEGTAGVVFDYCR